MDLYFEFDFAEIADHLPGINIDLKAFSISESERMEKLNAEDKYFESRNSELENEYETQDLYHKLTTLEEREWIYQEHINELAKREASCRAELEESLVKLVCRDKMNDALEKKFLEEISTYAKLVSGTLQQVESVRLELREANKKLTVVIGELGEVDSYISLTELNLQLANERLTRRDSDVKDLNNRLCLSEERANEAIALLEQRNDELISLTRTAEGLQINNPIIEKEKLMLTQELASKIKESQVAMEVVCREKEDIFKELEDTKLQSQIKEKELKEELEVALCEKKIFVEHLRFKLQSQSQEKKRRTKRAVRVTRIKLSKTWRKKNKTKREVKATCIKLIVALIFAFISLIYLWGKKY